VWRLATIQGTSTVTTQLCVIIAIGRRLRKFHLYKNLLPFARISLREKIGNYLQRVGPEHVIIIIARNRRYVGKCGTTKYQHKIVGIAYGNWKSDVTVAQFEWPIKKREQKNNGRDPCNRRTLNRWEECYVAKPLEHEKRWHIEWTRTGYLNQFRLRSIHDCGPLETDARFLESMIDYRIDTSSLIGSR